jgi:hypothetical protein
MNKCGNYSMNDEYGMIKTIKEHDKRKELIEKLEQGVMICDKTGTTLVHLKVEDVENIIRMLANDGEIK